MSTATATALMGIEEACAAGVDIVCINHECCAGRATVVPAHKQGGNVAPAPQLAPGQLHPVRRTEFQWFTVFCNACKTRKLWQTYTRGQRTMVEPFDPEILAAPKPAVSPVARRGGFPTT